MSAWRARLGDRAPALFLSGIGLSGLYLASKLTFGTVHQPGSGFYPTFVCILLAVFGALSLTSPQEPVAEGDPASAGGQGRIWLIVAALALYTWALPTVGFILCTAALLLLLLRVGKVSWTGSAVTAVVGSLACYGVFVKLGLPLPAGLLPF